MKIAFIGQKGIPAKSGGVEAHVEEVAKRLCLAGHEVFVYTRPNYTPKKLKEWKGIKLVSLPSLTTKHLEAISHTFLACLHVVFKKVDVVHFHSIGPSSLIWLVKIFKPRTPVVFTFHTQCYYHQKWGKVAKSFLQSGERFACQSADSTITVSQSLTKYVFEKYQKKAVYIPNGAVVSKVLPADLITKEFGLEKGNYILAVSRLVRHKGIQYLIKAYQQMQTSKKLVIVGDGAYTDEYVRELKALAEGNPNIIFTGNQTGAILQELFSNAFLFVQPSESEGLSIALLEAMSYSLPVLASDIPENLEVLGDLGEKFIKNDVADLRAKLELMLENEANLQKTGKMLQKRVKDEYDWDKIVRQIESVYFEAIHRKNMILPVSEKVMPVN